MERFFCPATGEKALLESLPSRPLKFTLTTCFHAVTKELTPRLKDTKKTKKAHLNYPLLFFEPLSLRAFVLMKSRQAPPSLPGPTHRRRGSVRSCRGIALDNRPIAYGAQAEAALDHVIQTYYPQGRP